MKQKNALILKTVLVVIVVEIVLAGVYYLFAYDRNRFYTPELNKYFMEENLKKIKPLTEDLGGELMINEEDFEGILVYGAGTNTPEELEESRNFMDSRYDWTYVVFEDDSYEVYVSDVRYTSIIDAWQYGWWDRQGNLYADRYGDEAAKGKPNYRYRYEFWVVKNNDCYLMSVYCNNDNANTVFSACIESMDEWESAPDDSDH